MQSQVSVATIAQGDAASRRVKMVGIPQPKAVRNADALAGVRGFQPRRLGDASEAERPSLGRTQQRIELLGKTANFHCMKRDTIAVLRW